ncbi:hypothetical protein L7F22_032050 [Adiantum nelumboides]|nr:hypothetical protein [Adiantum nelumboides]
MELQVEGAPQPLVSFVGKQQYVKSAKDIYYFLQSPVFLKQLVFGILETLLVTIFPEMTRLVLDIRIQDHEELCDAQEELDDFSYLLDKAKEWHEDREGKRRKSCSNVHRIQMLQEAIESLTEKYEDQFQEEDKSDDEWGITTSIFPLVGKTQVQSCLTLPNALAVSSKSMKEVQAQSQPEEVKKVMLERGEEEEHPKSQRSQKEHLVSQNHTPNRLKGLQDAEELESTIERYLQSGQEIEDKSGPKSMQGSKEDIQILAKDMQISKGMEVPEDMLSPKSLQEIEFLKDQVTVHTVKISKGMEVPEDMLSPKSLQEIEFLKDQVTVHTVKTLHLQVNKRKVENGSLKHEDVEVQSRLDKVQKMLVEEGGSQEQLMSQKCQEDCQLSPNLT